MTSLLTGALLSPEDTPPPHNCTHQDEPAWSGQEGGPPVVVRGGHTQEGSRNTPLALLTGHFHSNTHTISVRGETTSLTETPLFLPSSLFPTDFLSVRANLKILHPPTIKNQAGCRKGRGSEEGGGKGVGFAAIVCSFSHKLESNSQCNFDSLRLHAV